MPQNKKRRKTTPRQQLGIQIALKLGLPTLCPLYNVDESQCKETGEYCRLPELDAKSNIDYRLCDVFSSWFWGMVQKEEETEGLAPSTPAKQSPETTSKEGKEENG